MTRFEFIRSVLAGLSAWLARPFFAKVPDRSPAELARLDAARRRVLAEPGIPLKPTTVTHSRDFSFIEWVPIKERLPDHERAVLIAGRGTRYEYEGCATLSIGWNHEHGWVFSGEEFLITHWAELPEPLETTA